MCAKPTAACEVREISGAARAAPLRSPPRSTARSALGPTTSPLCDVAWCAVAGATPRTPTPQPTRALLQPALLSHPKLAHSMRDHEHYGEPLTTITGPSAS